MSAVGGYRRSALSDAERAYFERVRSYAQSQIGPHVQAMDSAGAMQRELVAGLFEQELMGVEVPCCYGGAGGTFMDAILAIEAVAEVDASFALLLDIQNTLVERALMQWGSIEQQQHYLPRLTRNLVSAFALSEANSGSDAFSLRLRAQQTPTGWVLDGQKHWTSNSAEAGLFLVFANATPQDGYRGITAFLVEREHPGLTIGSPERKLGLRASSTCALSFDGCRVPKKSVLGPVGQGYKIAIGVLNEGRIGIGAQMIGIAQAAFDYTLTSCRESLNLEDQAVAFEVARLALELEAARLLVYNAARLKQAGAAFIRQAAMAKFYASSMAEQVVSRCIDLVGHSAIISASPLAKWYRDVKIGSIYEGSSNLQLLTIAKLIR